MENDTSIFNLSWENDFPQEPVCPKPKTLAEFYPDDSDALFIRFGYYPEINEITYMVQADPQDELHFFNAVLGKTIHNSTKMIWYQTMDRYIYQYYYLVYRHNRTSREVIKLPPILAEKYKNYLSRSELTRKTFPVNTKFFSAVKTDTLSKAQSDIYETPYFAHAAYLNILCWHLWVREDAKKKKSTIQFNGLTFKQANSPGLIPAFSLEDYVDHELCTGLSLCIEIAAILLEFENKTVRDRAFNEFCDHYLPKVAQSPMFFTRNTVARHFFQQILLADTWRKYRWNNTKSDSEFSDYEWSNLIELAGKHCNLLNLCPDVQDVPDSEIDAAIEHIEGLLSMVKLPVNLPNYVKQPKYGLAAFCHPSHNNVKTFLDKLKQMSMQEDTTNISRPRSKYDDLFCTVHQRILNALFTPVPPDLEGVVPASQGPDKMKA